MHALAPNVLHFIDTHTLLSRFITFEICGIIKVLTYEESQYRNHIKNFSKIKLYYQIASMLLQLKPSNNEVC